MSAILDDRDFGTPPSRAAQTVTLEIDGMPVAVPAGTSVMRAAAEAGHVGPEDLAAEVGALEIRGEDLVPVVVGDLEVRHGRVHAGTVHEDVDPPPRPLRRVEQRPHALPVDGIDADEGAVAAGGADRVEPGGPAAKGGLQPGDIILSANGRLIERSEELPTVVGLIRPGTDATLEVWRDRAIKRLPVRVGELDPPAPTVADAGKSASPATAADRLGLVVRELTAEERARAAAGDAAAGNLLVERAQGAAGESGIRRGDLILGVNGKRTRSLKEFRDAVAQAGKVVALLVQRGDQQVFIPVRPG